MSVYDSKKFYDLVRVWYAKLYESGFIDIEFPSRNFALGKFSRFLAKNGAHLRRTYDVNKRNYYLDSIAYYYRARFDTKYERYTWRKHCEGYSVRIIARMLTKHYDKPVSRGYVHKVIKKYRKRMLNFYRRTQLDDMLEQVESSANNLQTFMANNTPVDFDAN